MSDYQVEHAQRRDTASLLDELVGMIERAKSMPLSASVIVAKDEFLEVLGEAVDTLPAEFEEARRVLHDRNEVRNRAIRDADEILDEARARAAHMVDRTEVVRQARNQAERLVSDAEADARRIRHDADDYVDRKLAAFEIVLDRTMRTVQSGRERLTVVPITNEQSENGDAAIDEEAFFDQDQA